MSEFWTSKKLGKHQQLAKQAELLYEHYALCTPDKLLARLQQSTFEFGNYGPIAWKNILEDANLDDCLKPEYVTEALKVTTTRPAIGKGEFLFVSIFNNVGFAKGKGDLIDVNTNEKVEVKGISSTIGNGNSNAFATLNQSRLNAIGYMLKRTPTSVIDAAACNVIKSAMGKDVKTVYNVLSALRNTAMDYREVTEAACNFYFNTGKLLLTIAAMHLYSYMHIEDTNYLLAVNNEKFRCFERPNTLVEAAEILKNFEIHGWKIGESGVTVTLK